jgi:competence ComEA-like helix-hairpin-helix protein
VLRGPFPSDRRIASRRGLALVAVLWCFAILSVAVLSALHGTRLDLRVARNFADLEEARWLALAGIEKAKARIHEERLLLRSGTWDQRSSLRDDPRAFRDVPLGHGLFRVIRRAEPGEAPEGIVFGVSPEEGRLDVNRAPREEIARLPGMTPDVAAAIVDWRDEDHRPSEGGAEMDAYAALVPPRMPRNGPIETIREMLLIRGVTPELLLGEDANANGLLDPSEDDGDLSPPADDRDGVLDAGWSALITLDSSSEEVNARGAARVDLQSASESDIAAVEGMTADAARAIVHHRSEKRLESIADLLDVAPAPPPAKGAPGAGGGSGGSAAGRAAPGGKAVSEDLLKAVADGVSVRSDREVAGLVDINAAAEDVLACLPGIGPDLAAAIAAHRRQAGPFASIAHLLEVQGMTRESFRKVVNRVTVRSRTYRILSEGIVPATGARKRILAVVRAGEGGGVLLEYAEDA